MPLASARKSRSKLVQKTRKISAKNYMLQGQAGVWQVASQLAMRGHVPCFPGVDFGCDLVLDNGLRIQVKCATLRVIHGQNYPEGAYGFQLRRSAWFSNEKKAKRSSLHPYSEVADFFVLWGIDEDRFFIVPTSHAGKAIWFGRRGFNSKSNNRTVYGRVTAERIAEFEDRWDRLDVNATVDAMVAAEVKERV